MLKNHICGPKQCNESERAVRIDCCFLVDFRPSYSCKPVSWTSLFALSERGVIEHWKGVLWLSWFWVEIQYSKTKGSDLTRLLSVNASSISISSPFSFIAFLIEKVAKMDAMIYHIFELMDVSRWACPEWKCWPWNSPDVGQRIPCWCHCQANRQLVLRSSLTFDQSHKPK